MKSETITCDCPGCEVKIGDDYFEVCVSREGTKVGVDGWVYDQTKYYCLNHLTYGKSRLGQIVCKAIIKFYGWFMFVIFFVGIVIGMGFMWALG